ncbi:MAG: T9SS type A sorting domain-containing protein, partial [Flavobacteriaceae bacterium]|nr:T9SS type A sorting domain-containing protein [Flavobacteriaceae bacterium]
AGEFDHATGTYYAIGDSNLAVLDFGALTATVVGPTGLAFGIGLAIDGAGNAYAYDVADDNLYSIDLGTGAATLIGAIGFDANFGQGMFWDAASDTVIMTAFNNGLFDSELRTVDTATGNTTLINQMDAGGLTQYAWSSAPGIPVVLPPNDECAGAIDVNCGDVVVGETITATDSGDNAAPDLWYSFTGMGVVQDVTVSFCDGGTDYDSLVRIYDACGGTQIDSNDDSCGLQSEITFSSDGTSTYYIMVEGFGSNSGNFSMAITCNPDDPTGPPNDECVDALAVDCGDVVVGETITATDSGQNAANDLWYSYTGTVAGEEVTLSFCDGGTDYDSLVRVFDACAGTEIAVNDDSCGLQSEVTFTSDGSTTYYIMVEGFGSNNGNFSMEVSCVVSGIEANAIAGFNYYPNPVTDAINLSAQSNIETVAIYNVLGQKVVDQNVEATATSLNVSNLSVGTYIMKVSVDGQIGTYKIVKQ